MLIFQVKDHLEDGESLAGALCTCGLVVQCGIGDSVGARGAVSLAELCNVLRLEPHQESLDAELGLLGHVGGRLCFRPKQISQICQLLLLGLVLE